MKLKGVKLWLVWIGSAGILIHSYLDMSAIKYYLLSLLILSVILTMVGE